MAVGRSRATRRGREGREASSKGRRYTFVMTHTSRQSVTFIIMRRSSRHLAFIVVGVKAVFMALVVTDECEAGH